MLDKLLQMLLKKYFGEFLTGMQNMELGIWSGKINLENISLKHKKINQLLKVHNIPLYIKYSHIGSLTIDIPWNKLSSAAVEIKIADILIVLNIDKIRSVDQKILQQKLSLLKSYAQQLINNALKENSIDQEVKEMGYKQKFILKLINNLNLEVKNVSVRVQSNENFFDRDSSDQLNRSSQISQGVHSQYSSSHFSHSVHLQKPKNKQIAFGFCLESLNSNTIDEHHNIIYNQMENDKTPLIKLIRFNKISVYWQEQNKLELFKLTSKQKNAALLGRIHGEENNLLSISGNMILRKNAENLDYLFEVKFERLDISSNYEQLEGMIKVYSNFSLASQSKSIGKMEQLSEEQQQNLKDQFKKQFSILQMQNFNKAKCSLEAATIIRSVSKKNLLSWSKQSIIKIIKQTKLQNLKNEKNKKGWFGFLAAKAEIQLTEQEYEAAMKQVDKIIEELQLKKKKKLKVGLNILLDHFNVYISHLKMKQNFCLSFCKTKFQYAKFSDKSGTIALRVQDISFLYQDTANLAGSYLIRKFSQQNEPNINPILNFQLLQSAKKDKVVIEVDELEINHQSKVLILINELFKLKQRQEMQSDVAIKKIQLNWNEQNKEKKEIDHKQETKNYEIRILFKQIRFRIEVSQKSYLLAVVEGIKVGTTNELHQGAIMNLKLNYIKGTNYNNPIIDDLSIKLFISNSFKKMNFRVSKLAVILCEEDLKYIYKNFKLQFSVLKKQKTEQKNRRIQQITLMQGELKTLTIFKNWRKYYAKLTEDSIYFYKMQEHDDIPEEENPINAILLKDSSIEQISECRFKIESDEINELVQCEKEVCQIWISAIQKVIFQCSSSQKVFSMINGSTKSSKKSFDEDEVISQSFELEIQSFQAMFCQTLGRNIGSLICKEIRVALSQNQVKFCRQFSVLDLKIKNCIPSVQSQLTYLVCTNFKGNEEKPLQITVSGKKKLHPQYKGELSIAIKIPEIRINYDPEFIYKIIKKISWNFEVPVYSKQMRDVKVLQLTQQFLKSKEYQNLTEKMKGSNPIEEDYNIYMDINNFKRYNTANVMLKVDAAIQQIEINLMNGLHHICLFNAQIHNIRFKIDKGSTFFFFNLSASDLALYDTTNYPNTNPQPWVYPSNKYPLISIKSERMFKDCLQCALGRFSLERFLNSDNLKAIFGLQLNDVELNYQNQPINRFIDYLLNPIIGFIMSPHDLHLYDGPVRGPFKYFEYLDMTQKQVQDYIESFILPFFTKLIITAKNLTANFNSHPYQEGIPIIIENVKFETHHSPNSDRISFKNSELKKFEKYSVFQTLTGINAFQQTILKNHWGCKFAIVASGCKSPIFDNEFQISVIIQRAVQSQKQTLFPFVKINTDVICKGWIENLSIRAPKPVYDLINRCIMHNLSYDDGKDKYFMSNYDFRDLMSSNEIYFSLKAKQLSIVVPELEQVIAIPDFEYIFLKYPSTLKEMYIYGKSLNIFGDDMCLIIPVDQALYEDQSDFKKNPRTFSNIKSDHTDDRGLQYFIQMKNDGTKVMSVILKSMQITYNLQLFMKLLQYFLLDQSCYPTATDLSDLPFIICDVKLMNTYIKFFTSTSFPGILEQARYQITNQYLGVGNINMVWTRNKVMHPQVYERDPSKFPSGTEWCYYRIYVKNFLLRKYIFSQKSHNQSSLLSLGSENKRIKKNYRSLSHPISFMVTISQLMKMAQNGQKYNDNIFTIKISSLLLKICYRDIVEIQQYFASHSPQKQKPPDSSQIHPISQPSQIISQKSYHQDQYMEISESQQLKPEQSQSLTSFTKYTIDIKKFSFTLGLSELPVPILDLTLKNSNILMEFFGENKSIFIDANVLASYWNMLIGKWQPIIQRFSPKISLRLVSPNKYIVIECQQIFNVDISIQALKVLSILSADVSEKGQFSFIKKNTANSIQPKGNNVSPYILTNKTGFSLIVSSSLIEKIKLQSDDRMYVEVESLEIERQQTQMVIFRLQSTGDSTEFQEYYEKQIKLEEAVTKKMSVRSNKNRDYLLYLKIISTAIMKQLIICSPYQIQNQTSHLFIFYYDRYSIKVQPGQKLALNFTANLKKRPLKIKFPFLEYKSDKNGINSTKSFSDERITEKHQNRKIVENCEFPFQILSNGYEHGIVMDDHSTFNIVINIQQDPETIITVQPAFYIKNLLPFELPVGFTIINQQKNKCLFQYRLEINQEKHIYEFSNQNNSHLDQQKLERNNQNQIRVRAKVQGYNISSFQSISDPNKSSEYKSYLDLIDYRGNSGKISMKVVKDGKVRKLYFYSEAILINQTNFNWYIFIQKNKFLPGQRLKEKYEDLESPYHLINQGKRVNLNTDNDSNPLNIYFGFRESGSDSNEVSIAQIGLQQVKMIRGSALYQFTVKNTLTQLDTTGKIYSNILKAVPKYVLINNTSSYLVIAQNKVFTQIFQIKPEERKNWIWPNKAQEKKIVIKLIENEIDLQNESLEWDYSVPINIENIEEQILVLRPKNSSSQRKLIQISPIYEHQSTFILIDEVQKTEEALITIKNQLNFNKLAIYQEIVDKSNPVWANYKYFQVEPNCKIPYGWDDPNAPHTLVVVFSFLSYMKSQFQPFKLSIDTSVQRSLEARTINADNQVYEILVQVEVFGLRKVITFKKKQQENVDNDEEQLIHGGGKIAFTFLEIGISLIGRSNMNKRVEVLFLSLKKLELIVMEKKSSKIIQLRIKYINIDNNMDHNAIYPIMLTPLRHEKTLNKSRPFFVMILQQKIGHEGSIKEFKQFRICLEPISLKIHDEILMALFDMAKVIGKIKFDDNEQVDLMAIYRAYEIKREWETMALHKSVSDIFIRELEIARLALQITFSIRPKFNKQNFLITTILSSFGVAISNVSEAQLTLSRFYKKDTYISQIKHELGDFYLKQFGKGIMKVIGSINLFGNPYVLIRMFAEGTWEIINQPTEGFIKGPIQGGIGIVKGGVFFTRNLVAGVCNSFEAISESVSRGVASMTLDQKFIERRQKIKIQKSEHLFKGLQHGGFAVYTGVEVAITGLVRHPVEGYETKGFIGGVTGSLKGVAGLVTKPISGTFEGISKVSEGIKNTALLFQDGPNSKRVRPPRIFIGELQHYRPYNFEDSLAISILEKASTKYLNSRIDYIHTHYEHEKQTRETTILTDKFFSRVDLVNEKIIIDLEIGQIDGVSLDNNCLVMKLMGGMKLPIHTGNLKDLYNCFKKSTVPVDE